MKLCKYCTSHNLYQKKISVHVGIYCKDCGKWQAFIKQPIENFTLPFGKYQGKKLVSIAKLSPQYLNWLLLRTDIKENFKNRISEALSYESE